MTATRTIPALGGTAASGPGRAPGRAPRPRRPRVRPLVAAVVAAAATWLAAAPAQARAATPGVLPAAAPGADASGAERAAERDWIERTLAAMSLEAKVGQLFVANAYGRSVDEPDPAMVAANQTLYGLDDFSALIERYQLGGIVYFGFSNNTNDPDQIVGLSNGIQGVAQRLPTPVPLLVSTDQEQGRVLRIGPPATVFPGNMALGATRDAGLAERAAAITGRELRAMGVHVDYAPVVDVNVNPLNRADGVRAYGDRTELVARLGRAQVRGYHRGGVAATAKHFPGLGDADINTDFGSVVSDQTLAEVRAVNLPPFRAAVEAGVDQVMVGHIVLPEVDPSGVPASLSRRIVTGLLRDELGYDGVVVTDALNAAALDAYPPERVAVMALQAGVDVLLESAGPPPTRSDLPAAYDAVLRAVRTGEIAEARIDRSVVRVLRQKWRLGLVADPFVDPGRVERVVGTPEHLAVATRTAERAVTLLRNDAGALPLTATATAGGSATGSRVLVTGFGDATTAALGRELAARGLSAQVVATGTNPAQAAIDQAVAAAAASDLVVVTTFDAWASPGQAALVPALLATGTPVVVVATGTPYDVAYFPTAPTVVAAYGFQPVSLAAVARVLFGEIEPAGRLPVTVRAPLGSGAVLYPYGYGLGYRARSAA